MGMNKSTWIATNIGSVCSAIYSGGTPSTTNFDYWNGNIPWLSSGETRESFITTTEKKITEKGVSNSSTRLALNGDIVMASAGQGKTRGQTSFLKIDTYVNQSIIVLRTNEKLINKFLFYFLKSKYDELRGGSDASSIRGSITTKDLSCFKMCYPEKIEVQQKIITALSAYDNLIENNNRRIAILEDMAQKLYREWFVHFRFPGHENVKMVESEMGFVPEGWQLSTIEKNTTLLRRGITPKYDEFASKIVVNQKCVRNYSVDMGQARKQSKDYPSELNLQCGDVLINSTGAGTLGRVGQIFENTPDTTVDSHVTIVRPSQKCICYVGAILKSLQAELMDMGVGSTNQTELNRDLIKSIPIVIPTDEVLNIFERNVHGWMILKNKLAFQNTNLRKTRDLLLPRLISGDIDVSDLDIPIKEG